jgi:hypothetical protein
MRNLCRAGIHQQIEIAGKNSTFGDVDILPSISLVFTNKKQSCGSSSKIEKMSHLEFPWVLGGGGHAQKGKYHSWALTD